MRPVKVLGLAVLASLAVMSFIAASSASALSDVVLCHESKQTTCTPEANVWEAGKVITGTDEGLSFLGEMISIECASSKLKGPMLDKSSDPLRWKIETATITGCGGGCSATIEGLTEGKFTVDAGDAYLLVLDLKVKIQCKLNTCVFHGEIDLAIDKPNEGGKPLALANKLFLPYEAGTFCDKKIPLDAAYLLEGGALEVYLSLYPLP